MKWSCIIPLTLKEHRFELYESTYSQIKKNVQLPLHVPWLCIHRFNQLWKITAFWIRGWESMDMYRADCMHCLTPFHIRDLSVNFGTPEGQVSWNQCPMDTEGWLKFCGSYKRIFNCGGLVLLIPSLFMSLLSCTNLIYLLRKGIFYQWVIQKTKTLKTWLYIPMLLTSHICIVCHWLNMGEFVSLIKPISLMCIVF